jgi:uncharacterized membrane protein
MSFLALLIALWGLGTAWRAVHHAGVLRAQLARVGARLDALERSVVEPSEPATPAASPAASVAPEAREEAAPAAEAASLPGPSNPIARASAAWEQVLVEHWLVWLGGAALALGGGFLVKLSIDYGLLTPPVRVVLGLVLGLGLSVVAEWVRLRDAPADAPSYVPPSLAAAGAVTVFASLYAAYALYGLLPSLIAFVLLAATSAATVAQSLRYGKFVAALGLVGAYAVPFLVTSEHPRALPLFLYLTVVTGGTLALLRHREWWWLAWLSLTGGMLWVPLWLAGTTESEPGVAAAYLLVQLGLFVAFRRGVVGIGFLAGVAETRMVLLVTRAAVWAVVALLIIVAQAHGYGNASVGAAALAAVALLALARRDPWLDDTIYASGALALLLLGSWTLSLSHPDMNYRVFRIGPDDVTRFTATAVAFAALLGGGCFLMLPRVARPGRWAALSASAAPLILTVAYWKLQEFDLPVAWTATALALAGVEVAAAAWVAKQRNGGVEIELALASYAVGALSATIVAAAFGLGEAWLTVALALHLPAMGWVDGRLRIPAMRRAALAVAGVVLVRLVLNPYVLQYPIGATPIFNWLLYGYGVPAAAFILATRQFGSRRDDWLVWMLEAGSAVFTLLLLILELEHSLYGRLTVWPLRDFGNGAALIALCLACATSLLVLGDRRQRPVLQWGGALLLGAVMIVAVPWQIIELALGTSVGNLPVFDAVLLADAVPAAIFAILAWLCPTRPALRASSRVVASLFAFVWLTLEIRHGFHGTVGLFARSTEAEWYAYSLAWLVFAGAMLGLGLARGSEWLRRAGLVGIGIVISKVFLSDMAALEGVLRALSFLGLGGGLVALGYAYRRLQPVSRSEPSAAPR